MEFIIIGIIVIVILSLRFILKGMSDAQTRFHHRSKKSENTKPKNVDRLGLSLEKIDNSVMKKGFSDVIQKWATVIFYLSLALALMVFVAGIVFYIYTKNGLPVNTRFYNLLYFTVFSVLICVGGWVSQIMIKGFSIIVENNEEMINERKQKNLNDQK
jgi:putative Mn2+ efflux pump MntP